MQRAVFAVLALTSLLLSAPAAAQTLIVEAEAGVETLGFCDWVHVSLTCNDRHVENEVAPSVGGILQLDGERYVVEWMGPGYHLESGLILQPTGATKSRLRGQRWLEVYPVQGRIHTSRAWKDVDGNRALSRSDTLTFGTGSPLGVKDVRLQLRLKPAREEPR